MDLKLMWRSNIKAVVQTLFVCLGISSGLSAQNKTWKYFEDSVTQVAETDYVRAKKNLLNCGPCKYDPVDLFYFMIPVIRNKDFRFYKKTMKVLIEDFGFQYTYRDTLIQAFENVLLDEIYLNNLHHWTLKTSKKKFPKYIKENPNSIFISNTLNNIRRMDQYSRFYVFNFKYKLLPKLTSLDSLDVQKVEFHVDSLVNAQDLDHIIQIQDLCIKNGRRLPTNFEGTWNASGKVSFIIFHNLKQGNNIDQVRERLMPYVEKAFLEGSLPAYQFESFDYYLNEYFGVQYYGTLNEVPLASYAKNEEFRKILAKYRNL
jgi:hypothetical protein